MRKVTRGQILDYQSYGDVREALRQEVLREKELRRIHVGEFLTFLFENALTVRYQVQEMMRLEHMAREKDIEHELATYNQLLGNDGELGCTLLIEVDDATLRTRYLKEWLGLPAHLYMRTLQGRRVPAQWDSAQVGDDRLSSVQYLKFALGQDTPVALGADHPAYRAETELTEQQRSALLLDLGS